MPTSETLIIPIITLIAGILILAWPKMFRLLLGLYLLLIGIVGIAQVIFT